MDSNDPFYQIATISSNEVQMNDDGDFSYKSGDLIIYYNFWAANGKVSFFVENNSTKDIILDLSKSYLIKNGLAHDYFLNRTKIYSAGSSIAGSRSVSSSKGASASVSDYSLTPEFALDYYTPQIGSSSSLSASREITGTASISTSASSSYSVEYKEFEQVTIPANSTKYFGEYPVSNGEYAQCGLIRNPSGSEDACIKYTDKTSPYVLENRLVFIVEGQEVPISNHFYVSEFLNLPETSVMKEDAITNCKGVTSYSTGMQKNLRNVYKSPNKYYVKYTFSQGDETGRVRATKKEPNKYYFSTF